MELHNPAALRRFCVLFVLGLATTEVLAQVVVVVGVNSRIETLTKEQVAAAFMGRVAGVQPVDHSEGADIREAFYVRDIGKSPAQMRAYWAKLSFTGKGLPPREYSGSAEIKKILTNNPAAISYIEKAAVDASVRVVFEGH
jgi:ABC-type phosphate transport system substrate-binding protein